MSTSKGHIQPHYTHLPRRRPRMRSPPYPGSHANIIASRHVPLSKDRFPQTGLDSSSASTESTAFPYFRERTHPFSGRPHDATPLTSPSELIPPSDTLPHKFPISQSQPQTAPAEAGDGPTQPPRLTLLTYTDQIHGLPAHAHVRGHLEPRAGNLPRRHRRAHKKRERIDRRCLQELFKGSGIWIAFNPGFGEGAEDGSNEELSCEGEREWNWMWEEGRGFTGVIRVRVGEAHSEHHKKRQGRRGEGEELELIIGEEEARVRDATGVSALNPSQLQVAAKFLVDSREREDGMGKVLITVPASSPVEALSIILLALSLHSLSQIEFQRGMQGQATHDAKPLECGMRDLLQEYTSIQLTLWHLHDLVLPDEIDDHIDELKPEWRGALSIDGVEKLESLIAHR